MVSPWRPWQNPLWNRPTSLQLYVDAPPSVTTPLHPGVHRYLKRLTAERYEKRLRVNASLARQLELGAISVEQAREMMGWDSA